MNATFFRARQKYKLIKYIKETQLNFLRWVITSCIFSGRSRRTAPCSSPCCPLPSRHCSGSTTSKSINQRHWLGPGRKVFSFFSQKFISLLLIPFLSADCRLHLFTWVTKLKNLSKRRFRGASEETLKQFYVLKSLQKIHRKCLPNVLTVIA